MNEDAFGLPRDGMPLVFIVTDGHGPESESSTNRDFAWFVTRTLQNEFSGSHTDDLVDLFITTAIECEQAFRIARRGAVSVLMTVDDTWVTTAWVGDCRAYAMIPNTGVVQITRDHSLAREEERRRIQPYYRKGLFVPPEHKHLHELGSWLYKSNRLIRRMPGGLESIAPTRAFGDSLYRPALIHDPEITRIPRSDFVPGSLIALCSDGTIEAVERILQFALSSGSFTAEVCCRVAKRHFDVHPPEDDATVIFVEFDS